MTTVSGEHPHSAVNTRNMLGHQQHSDTLSWILWTCVRPGHDHSEWRTSSQCRKHKEHVGSSTTQRHIKLDSVGTAFLHALYK